MLPVIVGGKGDSQHVKNNAMTVGKINFIVSCLIYDSTSTLAALQQNNYLNTFMETWFALIPLLKRVYDIKVLILGLISLTNNSEAMLSNPSLGQHIGSGLAKLYTTLPGAIKAFEKQRVEFNEADFPTTHDFNRDFEEGEFEDLDDEDQHFENSKDASTDEYLDFLKQENNKLTQSGFTEEDEPVYEDPLATTPLDAINPFDAFKELYSTLQSQNPPLHSMI
ncbi:hypothetical protein DND36_31690, partial [Pseudomonas savastanoi pv. glycinea]